MMDLQTRIDEMKEARSHVRVAIGILEGYSLSGTRVKLRELEGQLTIAIKRRERS
ncbi:hypothetical protein LCGC14_2210790 [marine sediment metagenome]|uniref:Uncharacterized protein n=1 Tax=marine sediment metagenome TaxID=412755 RepID=A0A0F9FRC7_9ZZZZ